VIGETWMLGVGVAASAIVVVRQGARGVPAGRLLLTAAALFHCVAVLALTIFPIPITAEAIAAARAAAIVDHNSTLLATFARQLSDGFDANEARQLIGNALLLMPMGIWAPMLWRAFSGWLPFLALALGASLAIELGQLGMSALVGFPYRIADVDDVTVNTAGALLAFAAWRAVAPRPAQHDG